MLRGVRALKVTLVALSEFGRRVAQNASYGLDHGYRSVLAEVVTSRFRASSATVFPGFQPESVGVMTSI